MRTFRLSQPPVMPSRLSRSLIATAIGRLMGVERTMTPVPSTVGHVRAGAVLILLVAGCASVSAPTEGPADMPPSQSASPQASGALSTTAAPLSEAGDGSLAAGEYLADQPFEVPLVVTVPDGGWRVNHHGSGVTSLVKSHDDERNAAFASFFLIGSVYADPCAGGAPDDSAVDEPAALVEALRSQPGFAVGEMTQGALGGHPSWTWEVTPTVDIATCADDPWLYQFQLAVDDGPLDGGTVAGAVQQLTVIDIDGAPLVAEVGTFPWTTEEDLREAVAIIESVEFGQP